MTVVTYPEIMVIEVEWTASSLSCASFLYFALKVITVGIKMETSQLEWNLLLRNWKLYSALQSVIHLLLSDNMKTTKRK